MEVGFFVRLFEALVGGGHALILYHDSRINQHKDWDQPLFVVKCPDLQIESVILFGQCPFYLFVGPKSRINLSPNSYHNTLVCNIIELLDPINLFIKQIDKIVF